MECEKCNYVCVKRGFNKSVQRWFCKTCKKYQQKTYTYRLCTVEDDETIIKLNNIGVGINGIAKFTGISKSNVVNRIKRISEKIIKPQLQESYQEYEVDEMYIFVGNKKSTCYITYALNKETKQVIDLVVGGRTKDTIGKVIEILKTLNPKRIFTDRLNVYPSLIDRHIHRTNAFKINHIERFNLTLRTHLKRLSRRSICFSKSKEMLESCLKIYLWGRG